MMVDNALAFKIKRFFSDEAGQDRRAWLDENLASANDALGYYLGPTGIPDKLSGLGEVLNYTDAGDMIAAADASRGFWNSPSVGNAAELAAAAGALAIPFVGARMIDDGVDVVGDAYRSFADDAGRFAADESGALNLDLLRQKYQGVKIDVSGNPSRRYTINRVVVPDGERNKGIGSAVMNDILSQADADGARVSLTPSGDFGGNKSRLKDFYGRMGFVENRGRARDFEVSEEMYRDPQKNALRPSQAKAQEVLDMLKSGRASEVTDDMMAAADDMYLYDNYDLPMDEASRMGRAKDMGFDADAPLYHGTKSPDDFAELNPSQRGKIGPGVYMTPAPNRASVFAGADQASIMAREQPLTNARVMPLVATNNPADDAARAAARGARDNYEGDHIAAYQDVFDARGFDGVSVQDERTIIDPRNIRSRFARFDPRLSHLRNLSAGIGAAGVMTMQSSAEREERALRNYLGYD